MDNTTEKMMSIDEFKAGMFKSLRDTGAIEMIRAQVRRQFIEKLQNNGQQPTSDERESTNDNNNNKSQFNMMDRSWSVNEQLVHGLILNYLICHGLEHTTAVFVPEIGGRQNQLSVDAIIQILQLREDQKAFINQATENGNSLVLILLNEFRDRLSVSTIESGTQTTLDCFDHRLLLENQLRHVETTYLRECAAYQSEPTRSVEERMANYQREYDAVCQNRSREELERFKTIEIERMRVEERKKYAMELEKLTTSYVNDQHNKVEKLQDRERQMEAQLVARRTELETSLFETRQALFQDMEKIRIKETRLQSELDTRNRQVENDTTQLQAQEERVKIREETIHHTIRQKVYEVEAKWRIKRSQLQQELHLADDRVKSLETTMIHDKDTIKQQMKDKKCQDVQLDRLEDELTKAKESLHITQRAITQLECEQTTLKRSLQEKMDILREEGDTYKNLNYDSIRLQAENKTLQASHSKLNESCTEYETERNQLRSEVQGLQSKMLVLKVQEADAVASEREKLMNIMDEERQSFRWKESERILALQELQTHLVEREATLHKFQNQYEDEKICAQSLREEVNNLNTLLTQAQATINAKHGTTTYGRGSNNASRIGSHYGEKWNGDDNHHDPSTDRLMMKKIREFMSNFETAQVVRPRVVVEEQPWQQKLDNDQPKYEVYSRNATNTVCMDDPTIRDDNIKPNDEQPRFIKTVSERRRQERLRLVRETLDQEEEEELRERKVQLERKRTTRLKEEEEEERIKILAVEKVFSARTLKVATDMLVQEKTKLPPTVPESLRQEVNISEELTIDQLMINEKCRKNLELEQCNVDEIDETNELEEAVIALQTKRLSGDDESQQMEQKTLYEREEHKNEVERRIQRSMSRENEEMEYKRREEMLIEDNESENFKKVITPVVCEGTLVMDRKDPKIINQTSEHSEELQSDLQVETKTENPAIDNIGKRTATTTEDLTDPLKQQQQEEGTITQPELNETITSVAISDYPPSVDIEDAQVTIGMTEEEREEQNRQENSDTKRIEDESVIDVYRQRVLVRKAVEKTRQLEAEAQKRKEEVSSAVIDVAEESEESEEFELSEGSFADSSAVGSDESF